MLTVLILAVVVAVVLPGAVWLGRVSFPVTEAIGDFFYSLTHKN